MDYSKAEKRLMKIGKLFLGVTLAGLAGGCAYEVVQHPAAVDVEQYHVLPTGSPGAKFGILPSQVQRTITVQGGAAEISDINKVTGADRDIYEVQFRDPAINPPLYVAGDGTLINGGSRPAVGAPGSMAGTSTGGDLVGSLPESVQKTLAIQAPHAVVTDVQTKTQSLYHISFKDPDTHPNMVIAEDGTLLRQGP